MECGRPIETVVGREDDDFGGVTLEPAITQAVDDILTEQGGQRLTPEEFDEHFGRLPSDGEG